MIIFCGFTNLVVYVGGAELPWMKRTLLDTVELSIFSIVTEANMELLIKKGVAKKRAQQPAGQDES